MMILMVIYLIVVYNESKMESKQYRTEENLKIGISIFVYDGVPKSRLMQLLHFLICTYCDQNMHCAELILNMLILQ